MLDETHDHIKLFFSLALAGLSAVTLAEWVMITTIVYTLLQTILLIPRYISWFRNRKRKPRNDN